MFYSASQNGFFDEAMLAIYEAAGSWPDDAVKISDNLANILINRPADKIIIADEHGMPMLSDMPAPSHEQLTSIAMAQRDGVLRQAAIRIAPLQDAVDIGEATAAEEQQLLAWKKYRVAVNRITEQPGFPTAIEWPDMPSI